MVEKASYQVIWLPRDSKLPFDETKANLSIDNVEGNDYGYEVLLMGILDVRNKNLPCYRGPAFPESSNSICLELELLEVVFSFLGRYSPQMANIFTPAMNNRVGLRNQALHTVYYKAH